MLSGKLLSGFWPLNAAVIAFHLSVLQLSHDRELILGCGNMKKIQIRIVSPISLSYLSLTGYFRFVPCLPTRNRVIYSSDWVH